MLEAYHVAVKVALKDGVTAGLLGMSKQFGVLGKQAAELKKKLAEIKKVAIAGAGLLAGGLFGTHIIEKALRPAEEYAHQLNIMNIAGMTHLEIANSVAAAWKNTSTVITSTATGNLKAILDLRNILGKDNLTPLQSTKLAISEMPMLTKIQALLKASSESGVRANSDSLVYSLAKALDIRGAVLNPKEFNKESIMMAKVIEATQGRVLPSDYQSLFKYGRQAVPSLSDQFLYEELPTLMLQMKNAGGGTGGHGGFGVSLAAFSRFAVQGVMSKSALASMQALGLINKGAGLKTTTTGTMLLPNEHVKDVGLAASDPIQWMQKVMLPAIYKKHGNGLSDTKLSILIADSMRGASQTAIFAAQQYALKYGQIERDERLVKLAKDPMQAYKMSLSGDPQTVNAALTSQWQNFQVALTKGLIPILIPLLSNLTKGLNVLAIELQKHSTLAKILAVGFVSLFGAMSAVGTLLIAGASIAAGRTLIGAFGALRIALIPIAAVGGAVAVALTAIGVAIYEIYKHWASIKGFLKEGGQSLLATLGGGAPPPAFNQPVQVHTQINMDGKKIASAVTQHQGKATTSNQPNHGSSYNADMSFQPNMLNTSAFAF